MFLGSSDKNLNKLAEKIISDCLEAIIGAIYLDGGLKMVEKIYFKFLERLFRTVQDLTFIDTKFFTRI